MLSDDKVMTEAEMPKMFDPKQHAGKLDPFILVLPFVSLTQPDECEYQMIFSLIFPPKYFIV